VCDFLLEINILKYILSRTVSELLQLIVQILDTLRFESPFGGLGATYIVHLRLIGKLVVDFLSC